MAAGPYPHTTAKVVDFAGKDALFARIRADAQEAVRREPDLAGFLFANVLHHETLERAIVHRVAARLDHPDLGADAIAHAYSRRAGRGSLDHRGVPRRHSRRVRPRSGLHAADRAAALLQGLSRARRRIGWRMRC